MKKLINEIERLKLIAGLINEVEYNEALYGVKKSVLTEGQTKEAKKDEAVKAEVKAKAPSTKKPESLHIDQANPYEYRRGIQHELCELDEYTDEALEKAKTTVLKNLAKDANFYSNLLNQQQSPFEFKQTETDKPGMQAKADGYLKKELKKDEKSNVKDTQGKKEAGKKKPKGVKVMPDKGVTGSEKTIKEGIEENKESKFNIGDSLKTYGGEEAVTVVGIQPHLAAALKDMKNPIAVDYLKKALRQDLVDREQANQPWYLVKFEDGLPDTDLRYWAEDELVDDSNIEEAKKLVSKEDKIAVIKEWIWYTCDEGTAKEDIDKYNKMVDMYFADKNDVTKEDFKKIWAKVTEKYGAGDVGADWEAFPETWKDVQTGTLVNETEKIEEAKGKTYTIFDKARGEEVETYDTYEDAKAALDKINAEDPYHGDYVIDSEGLDEIMPGVDLGASFGKLKSELNAEDEFNQLLSKYDWYYEMSDDPRAYDRAEIVNNKLKALGKQIGVDKAVALFNDKAPSDRKITSTFFMEGKDKLSKIKEVLKKALKKTLKEEDPALSKLEKDEEAAEKALAQILTKKAAVLAKPGTQQ